MNRVAVQVDKSGLRAEGRKKSLQAMRVKGKNFVRVVKKMVQEKRYYRAQAVAITLTFTDNAAFRQCMERAPRSGVSQFMRDVVQYCERKGVQVLGYAYVVELQERGVPHYHVLMIVEKAVKLPKPDKWVWNYGMSNIFLLGPVDRLSVNYLVRYIGKGNQKGWAEVESEYCVNAETGRKEVINKDVLYGVKKYAWVIRVPEWKEVLRWLSLPGYVRRYAYFLGELPRRVNKAGWYFLGNRLLIMTDAQVILHKEKRKKRVAGHYFKYRFDLRQLPPSYAVFVYPSFIGVLEDIGPEELKQVQAEAGELRRQWGGAWYPLNAPVETVLYGSGDVMGRDEVFSLPLQWVAG